MKNIDKHILLALALFGLCGCNIAQKRVSNISVQDTLNAPIIVLSKKKLDAIDKFYSQSNEKPVVVFYTMQGCEPCKEIYPYYKKMAKKYGNNLAFGYEDWTFNRRLDKKRLKNIYIFPTVVIYNKGTVVEKMNGRNSISWHLEKELSEHSSH